MSIKLLYIDLFCGAGGTSTGVESARRNGEKCAKVITCVNHDANAIASHAANHPDVLHFTEDIRTLELSPLVAHVEKMKAQYPDALIVLWASLECTNFSRAKGGKPRDADSRTLAEHLYRYIEAINPDYIQIENVEEFMCWGDLDENGKPVSKSKGRKYLQWVEYVKTYGYKFNHRILNAADYGAYTSRKRFFGQFAKHVLPIAWPEQTHTKNQTSELFRQQLRKWKPVKDVLDFTDEGESIFTRKKPLSDKTLERIYAGLIKFVAGGKANFLSKFYSGHPESKNFSVEEPAHTVTPIDHHALVQAKFLSIYCGTPGQQYLNVLGIDSPSPTVTVFDRISLVSPKWHYLMNPQFLSAGRAVDEPCFTLIARMDKMPPYLVTTTKIGQIAIEVYDADSEPMRRIKELMAAYGIIDIKMRMLRIHELKRIMGFPEGYTLIGTQGEQKKYIGNAVEVNMARVICEALCKALPLPLVVEKTHRHKEAKIKFARIKM
jgi:DNA (cytosine-5)-methyltransferase 1